MWTDGAYCSADDGVARHQCSYLATPVFKCLWGGLNWPGGTAPDWAGLVVVFLVFVVVGQVRWWVFVLKYGWYEWLFCIVGR
ncbi:Uncharacterised protein [Actinomyces bovis]|uniref:Transmembrane protein n=1 Tax=Actinomyces bovis TaxID=1658 RepID=A0ABY1VLK9_9ACTO|nr:Uncharacterised protein [Actinomyces bovis]VEG54337.1 Uncharacterised protein [Actinomyces israelii]